LLRLPLVEAIAVVIMSSQKSAPVAVTVITYVTPDIAVQGLLSIPGLIGQLFQIFLGSVIAKVLAKKVGQTLREEYGLNLCEPSPLCWSILGCISRSNLLGRCQEIRRKK
jgi:hypothetical protein